MLASVLNLLEQKIEPGMTTKDAANLAASELKSLGGKPAFLGYGGGHGIPDFPDVLCISINEEVVHGIPGPRELKTGDVVSIDFGVEYEGLITDAAKTFRLGSSPTQDIDRLIQGTKQALEAGINAVKNGVRVGDISASIEAVLSQHQLGIVRELVGHGVGEHLHEEPNIPNYGSKGTGPVLKSGMTVALEPMAMLGQEQVGVAGDGWTIFTADHSLAAHFEHSILVTDNGAEILTTA